MDKVEKGKRIFLFEKHMGGGETMAIACNQIWCFIHLFCFYLHVSFFLRRCQLFHASLSVSWMWGYFFPSPFALQFWLSHGWWVRRNKFVGMMITQNEIAQNPTWNIHMTRPNRKNPTEKTEGEGGERHKKTVSNRAIIMMTMMTTKTMSTTTTNKIAR